MTIEEINKRKNEILNPFHSMHSLCNNLLNRLEQNPFEDKDNLIREVYKEETEKIVKMMHDLMEECALVDPQNVVMDEVDKILNPPTDEQN
jgi:hypothetical protein